MVTRILEQVSSREIVSSRWLVKTIGVGSFIILTHLGPPDGFFFIEGLPVLRLSRLIEIKIACGAENVRRMHKDFADVVELIE